MKNKMLIIIKTTLIIMIKKIKRVKNKLWKEDIVSCFRKSVSFGNVQRIFMF